MKGVESIPEFFRAAFNIKRPAPEWREAREVGSSE